MKLNAELHIPEEAREAAKKLTSYYHEMAQHHDAETKAAVDQEVQWAKGQRGLYMPAKTLEEALEYTPKADHACNIIEFSERDNSAAYAVVAPVDTFLLAGARCVVPSRFIPDAYEAVTGKSFPTEDTLDEIEEV